MSKKKLIDDTISYLKYYKEYNNYQVLINDLKEISEDTVYSMSQKEEEVIENEVIEEKKNILSKDELTSEIIIDKNDPVVSPVQQINENWVKCKSLEEFQAEINDCTKCKQLAESRKNLVFGSGNPNAKVVIVGEAPGKDEDEQGNPFVGRAGKLLTDILKAINFTREEVYICNILKCRPPENRNPLPDEIVNCEPYLFKQLEMIKPILILAVGAFAAKTLLRCDEPLGKMRGKFHLYNGIKMMVTYHPAALLRNPNWKRPTWEDVQLFRKEYDKIVNI